MTIQDIALFKSFIEANTLREIFIRGYRKSAHFSKNPASIEQYLAEVEAEDVIKKGITMFSTNQTFGYDFWQNTSDNWIVKLKQGRMGKSYTDYHKLIELEGVFKVLRENWDAAKSWLYEDVDKTLRRLGLQEDIAESRSKEEVVVENTSNEPTNNKPDFSGVPEFDEELEFFDISAGSKSHSTRLKKNEASLNFRSNSYKFTFNQELSKKIKDNSYQFVRLGKTKTGDIIIQLHKEEGNRMPVRVTFNNNNSGGFNACINSKDLCTKLKTLLNLTGDLFILKIDILSQNYDKMNFKVSK